MERKEISNLEIKEVELQLLSEIVEFCNKNSLRYWLTAGTLLGAIRHHGFIPWDDDIDIMMPRKDYAKLIDLCKTNETPFVLLTHETNSNYPFLFAKACSKKTIVEIDTIKIPKCELGLWVDIFPLDGLGNDINKSRKIINQARFPKYLLAASTWSKFFRSKSRHSIIEPVRFVFYLLGKLVNQGKLINTLENKYIHFDFDSSKYCACVCGNYGILDRDLFEESIIVTFENHKFRSIKQYDKYLRYLYGNYLEIPPLEKQINKHDFKAYWK